MHDVIVAVIMVTSMSLAVLESTVPLWAMDTMDITRWQLGKCVRVHARAFIRVSAYMRVREGVLYE